MRHLSLLLLSALLLTACSSFDSNSNEPHSVDLDKATSAEAGASIPASDADSYYADAAKPKDATSYDVHKFIWDADLNYQVENVDKATEEIQSWCAKEGAFVSNMRFSSDLGSYSNYMEIRVENKDFHKLVKRFRKQAKFVDNFEITSQDVTEEFVDIESRLNTKRDVRDRYIEVLRNKATNVQEILAAEQAIRVITEEIEAIEGRLRYLNDQVSFSTIRLTMYQKVNYKEQPSLYEKSYGDELSDGLSESWGAIKALFLFIVILWPLWLVLIVLLWKRSWIIRLFNRKPKIQQK